jgi:hypothetical protein
MLQAAFRDNAVNQRKTFYGTDASRTDGWLSTTLSVLDNRRHVAVLMTNCLIFIDLFSEILFCKKILNVKK